MITDLLRHLIHSRRLQRIALASDALEELARPYLVAGDADDAASEARVLRSRGLDVSFMYLPVPGEEASTAAELERLLEALGEDARGIELSVKPSRLGLQDSPGRAASALERLAAAADESGALVTLEMQGHEAYRETLQLWRAAHREHPDLGITLPVDIRRAERDLADIVDDSPRLRLCIGSYRVPKALGIQREHDKSRALVRCLRTAMEGGARAMLASHDPTIIAIAQELHRRTGSDFEFQMFYGVRPLEQRRLADIGYRSRVLVPYGPGWFDYLRTLVSRRPQTAVGYLRAVLDKR